MILFFQEMPRSKELGNNVHKIVTSDMPGFLEKFRGKPIRAWGFIIVNTKEGNLNLLTGRCLNKALFLVIT